MKIGEKIKSEGMRIAMSPHVAKLLQDERLLKLMMAAMSVPGRVSTFTKEQKESFAKTMGLATAEEVRDLRRTVAALEETVAKLRRPIPGDR